MRVTLEQIRGLHGFSYLGSPYSRFPGGLDMAAEIVARGAAELMRRGHRLFCPIAHSHTISMAGRINPKDWDFWRLQDEPMMKAANGLIILEMPTWEESIGLTDELAAFEWMGKAIASVTPQELGL